MEKVSRRAFSGAMLSATALAAAQESSGPANPASPAKVDLPSWKPSPAGGDRFEFPGKPSPRTKWTVPGPPRKYFPEWLPALFERTLEIDEWSGGKAQLRWIFTGPSGGFTVEAGNGKARLAVRYYDSPGLSKVPPVQARAGRHPEGLWEESSVEYGGDLKAITVVADYRLTVRVLLNGKEALSSRAPLDVNRHQLAFAGEDGRVRGRLLPPATEASTVDVDDAVRFQEILGWGGTTTPPAFAELSPEGVREWWRILAEYNLLLHREYPTGAMLNPEMTNWDRPEDAAPHYYGDNFPNCETSDFAYMRNVRRMGGKVIFEFWELPPWARVRDAAGKLTDAPEIDAYVKAMVRYCQVLRDKIGKAPEIVGIQNEVTQSAENWRKMAPALRQGLDAAGFASTRIHMHNASSLSGGVAAGKAFREDPAVWKTIDYATSNLYDFQSNFHDPDAFDARLTQLRDATAGKPFMAVELCVNNGEYQTRAYRVALAMGQLYHKVLTQLDACGVMYCWTLLNVVQPSYGWTRTLLAPDPEHGLKPVASSHQLRVFGAYTRRVREGMTRVGAASSNPNVLATAFRGADGARTLILLNRSAVAQKVAVKWLGAQFRYLETASPRAENHVAPSPQPAGGGLEVLVDPGAIVTLSNVELGKAPADLTRA
jgi:Glycosyl hydrolase family 30 beta sandwich domain